MFKNLFRKKLYDIPDSWTMCHVGTDRRAMMRINTPLHDFAHKDAFPVNTVFTVPMDSFSSETDIAYAFEDALFEQLQGRGRGIIVAVMTDALARDFITYTKTGKDGAQMTALLNTKFPKIAVKLSSKNDPAWTQFQSLLPDK